MNHHLSSWWSPVICLGETYAISMRRRRLWSAIRKCDPFYSLLESWFRVHSDVVPPSEGNQPRGVSLNAHSTYDSLTANISPFPFKRIPISFTNFIFLFYKQVRNCHLTRVCCEVLPYHPTTVPNARQEINISLWNFNSISFQLSQLAPLPYFLQHSAQRASVLRRMIPLHPHRMTLRKCPTTRV